jgi:HK97 family phage portal protein
VSLLHKRDYFGISNPSELIPPRASTTRAGTVNVTADSALRHSAVWACLRLRANLLSTMPVDAFRKVDDVQIEIPKPPVLVNPGGENVSIHEWLYSTTFDLDRCGNAFGIITERSGFGSGTGTGDGLPARIDLVAPGEVAIVVKKGKIDHYRIGGTVYQPSEVWHEKQYTVAGLHVGLSPVAYGAWSIGEYLSIQDFALGWFGGGGVPSAILTNKAKPTLKPGEADTIKERFKAAVQGRDIFVTGGDWVYEMVQAEQAGANWIEAKQYGIGDIARFFDVPGDLIDAAVTGVNLTYANAVQRNLQFLVMHLGPAVFRREQALSKLLPQPRYVKLNSGALLRMDPASQAQMLQVLIASRQVAPSEARALVDRPPFTEAQMAEFDRFWPPKPAPTTSNPQVPAGVSS